MKQKRERETIMSIFTPKVRKNGQKKKKERMKRQKGEEECYSQSL